MAYANNKTHLVSRSTGTKVKILNYFDGTDLGELPITVVAGGTFLLNDTKASGNGMLLVCNLITSTGASISQKNIILYSNTGNNIAL